MAAGAISLCLATPSFAMRINLDLGGLTSGTVNGPATVSTNGVDVTFSNANRGDKKLVLGTGLVGLTGKGICAGSRKKGLLTLLANTCDDPLRIALSVPVQKLAFRFNGIALASTVAGQVTYDGGKIAHFDQTDLVHLSLLGLVGTGFHFAAHKDITAVTLATHAAVSLNFGYVGDISFKASTDAVTVPEPVPGPLALPLMATGLGALLVVRRRRRAA